MSAQNNNSEGAQSPVLNASSFIGTAAKETVSGGVVTLLADGDLTVEFTEGTKTLTGLKGGMSIALGLGVLNVTSTAAVLIS